MLTPETYRVPPHAGYYDWRFGIDENQSLSLRSPGRFCCERLGAVNRKAQGHGVEDSATATRPLVAAMDGSKF